MSPKFKLAAANAAKVGIHIVVSILLVGAFNYFQGHVVYFNNYLVSFGVPVAVVNIISAAALKFLSAHQPIDAAVNSQPNA